MTVGVAAGEAHSLAYTSSGTVFAWGSNKHGQLGLPQSVTSSGVSGSQGTFLPKRVPLPFASNNTNNLHVKQVCASYNSSLLLTHIHQNSVNFRQNFVSDVYQWGDGTNTIRKVYFTSRMFSKRSRSREYSITDRFTEAAFGKWLSFSFPEVGRVF